MNDEQSLYEVGFHFVPDVSEEEAAKLFAKVTDSIVGHGGDIKVSGAPALRDLAYALTKAGSGKRQSYQSAYFGFVNFILEKSSIAKVKKDLEKIPEVLRFLILEIPPVALLPRERRIPQTHREEPKTEEVKSEVLPDANAEVALDKSIDELVIE